VPDISEFWTVSELIDVFTARQPEHAGESFESVLLTARWRSRG
jgi:hypothetical protein